MTDMPSYCMMAIKLYKRQQGILFKHRQNENITFQVVSKKFHDQPYGVFRINAEYPKFNDDPEYPASCI